MKKGIALTLPFIKMVFELLKADSERLIQKL